MGNQYICHYGTKGMKWGVRKKYDRSDVRSVSKRKLKKQMIGSVGENTKEIYKDVNNELNKTKEAKDFARVHEAYRAIDKKFKEEHPGKTLYYTKKDVAPYNDALSKYKSKAKELLDLRKDDIASATLKDLNYSDTKEGREYVLSLIERWSVE